MGLFGLALRSRPVCLDRSRDRREFLSIRIARADTIYYGTPPPVARSSHYVSAVLLLYLGLPVKTSRALHSRAIRSLF
ncbi:hypothetical protein NDU88_001728 [Pleurodeles waltl]|uniref:Uncharacterized protein n=1 Tax=Pleurodeles waltl TaxID=8319 RepID=A0AAV7U7N9_PLEWA|nr:hypothetical protein NDU88_001728 [Pleurodeles waltl]